MHVCTDAERVNMWCHRSGAGGRFVPVEYAPDIPCQPTPEVGVVNTIAGTATMIIMMLR